MTSIYEWQWHDTKTTDELLTRDWFTDDEMIEEVLNCADHDAWEWVYNNRAKYSTRIRMQIEPEDYRFPVEKLMLRVVDLTDKMLDKMESERKKQIDDAFEKDWVEHAKTIEDRPHEDIDYALDDAFEKLSIALKRYAEKPVSSKYIAPGSRSSVTKQAELEKCLAEAQNEYKRLQDEEEEVDTLYWITKRDEYRKTWMPNL